MVSSVTHLVLKCMLVVSGGASGRQLALADFLGELAALWEEEGRPEHTCSLVATT